MDIRGNIANAMIYPVWTKWGWIGDGWHIVDISLKWSFGGVPVKVRLLLELMFVLRVCSGV